jgi:hypothetical protein
MRDLTPDLEHSEEARSSPHLGLTGRDCWCKPSPDELAYARGYSNAPTRDCTRRTLLEDLSLTPTIRLLGTGEPWELQGEAPVATASANGNVGRCCQRQG